MDYENSVICEEDLYADNLKFWSLLPLKIRDLQEEYLNQVNTL